MELDFSALFRWEAPQSGAYDLFPKGTPHAIVWAYWNVIRNPWFTNVIKSLDTPIKAYNGTKELNQPVPNFNPNGTYWHLYLIDAKGRTGFYYSYKDKVIESYFGYKPHSGSFGAALRHSGAKPIEGKHIS